jgi:membrane protein implicated in regulation of membrane protease activity
LVGTISAVLPFPNLLIALWVVFSLLGVVLSRRFLTSKRKFENFGDDREGATLTTILPGKTGRVLYEGNSWQAKCADENMAVPQDETVYILEKQGNTLIVLPRKLLN